MAFFIPKRHLAVLGVMASAVLAGRSVLAAVPVSVAVRQQSPEVEQIISQLEAKAAGAAGTWTTKSGRQDVPAEEWTTTIQGHEWTLKSLAAAPSSSAGFMLYCDGEDCFTLPDGVRFQNDTLTQGKFQNFRLSHYLLLLNLQPRQLIGSLGGLKLLDDVTIDGVACAHLQANLAKDPLLATDKAVSKRSALLPKVDLYIDRQRQAVLQVSLTDPSGYRFESHVTAWDALGTSSMWPKALEARTYLSGTNPPREVDKPYLTSIEAFKSGQVAAIAAVRKAITATSFFSAPLDNLRSVDFYQKAVNQNPANLSDKVALTQASFNDGNAKVGLEMWTTLESQLPNAPDRERLRRVVVPHAAYGCWTSAQNKDQTTACVALIQKFMNDLPAQEFKQIVVSVFAGWETLYTNPKTRIALEPINAQLLERFIAQGDTYVFGRLVRLSKTKEYANAITPYLNKVVATTLPREGYTNSSLSYLVVAALQAQDFDNAKKYLQNPIWDPKTPEAVKGVVPAVLAAIAHVKALTASQGAPTANHGDAMGPVIQSFDAFATKPLAQDKITSQCIRGMLVTGGAAHVAAIANKSPEEAQSLLIQSATLPQSAVYWDQVIRSLMPDFAKSPQRLIAHVGPLIKTYAKAFNQPAYETRTWTSLSRVRKGYLGIQVEYLNKALAAAPDDATRFGVIQQLGGTYAQAHEYASGSQAVDGATQQLKDPTLVAKAQKLRDSLNQAASKEKDNALANRQKSQAQDQQKRLAYMESQLDLAKKRGASPDDLVSLQKTVDAMKADTLRSTGDLQ